jgi:phage shock protein A
MNFMLTLLRRVGKYTVAALSGKFDEHADPKVLLEQAIADAQEQHRRLREQAANVIANQKQTEMRLNRAMEDLERTHVSARQAVLAGDERTATLFAGKLVSVEKEVESLKELHLHATEAADQAKVAVEQNGYALQVKLDERQKLLSKLDQTRMQEQLNRAVATLSEAVGGDVPTLEEVRDRIEQRYARALGRAELQGQVTGGRTLEAEHAQLDLEARERLGRIRAELGIPATASTNGTR